ncbi:MULTISPECIES: hypothetical protein [unclassified Methylobacterium]|jgi:hypothetical protein|uniref:hypothetical protein n=1 Tax=unclassified Methylobacterium TaxID=2615210 RepID=UPI0013530FE1|nr:hypothetical protein [Methylobacterium sp. 2A]MWV25475.1 hypothetical protein [Methylobacterium sp. 2A]
MTIARVRREGDVEPSGQTAQQREARLEAEASMLAVARADIEHGRYIADGDVDAWLAAWESGEAVELPEASASSPRP